MHAQRFDHDSRSSGTPLSCDLHCCHLAATSHVVQFVFSATEVNRAPSLVGKDDVKASIYVDDIANRRKTLVSTGDRSAKIRTYNFPQGRVTDHRINYTIYNLPAFMNGDIQDCIDHLIVAENAERMKESEL